MDLMNILSLNMWLILWQYMFLCLSNTNCFFVIFFCFFKSGLRAGLAASIAGSSIISKMLLANIDPFGATPFIDPDPDSL